jgi:dihydrofolate reductase
MSLDGYIATADGGYDWIPPDTGVDFAALFARFDRFIMGRKTYELMRSQGQDAPAKGATTLVISTSMPNPGISGIEFASDGIAERVDEFKAGAQKDVWLFGGGAAFRSLLDHGLVDRVEVAVIPVLLGSGIPLVPAGITHRLKFESSKPLASGVVLLDYSVIN